MADNFDNYSLFSKLFHRLTLGNNIVPRTALDLECLLNRKKIPKTEINRPVYVSGLARSGTTILLKLLYSSGEFHSLTYRDMPLVTAPGLWKKVSRFNELRSAPRERVHGDGFRISYDSPEALEEIFWLLFSGYDYLQKDKLDIQRSASEDTKKNYRKFIANLMLSRSENKRYLAKNNNNLLRIDILKEIFPESIIIVPFRDPIDHASSLLRQHSRFTEIQKRDPFVLKYMDWLGHFEFGLHLKPYAVNNSRQTEYRDPENINYWINYWNCIYEYALRNHSDRVYFLNYEQLCREPARVLARLETILSINKNSLAGSIPDLKTPKKYSDPGAEKDLISRAKRLYETLMEKAFNI